MLRLHNSRKGDIFFEALDPTEVAVGHSQPVLSIPGHRWEGWIRPLTAGTGSGKSCMPVSSRRLCKLVLVKMPRCSRVPEILVPCKHGLSTVSQAVANLAGHSTQNVECSPDSCFRLLSLFSTSSRGPGIFRVPVDI